MKRFPFCWPRGFATTALVCTAVLFVLCTVFALALDVQSAEAAVPVANPDGVLPSQIAKLIASHGAANDAFGWSVAVSGDTMVVGAHVDDVGANVDQGSVYVFTRSGSTWTQEATLTASDGATDDRFSYALAISGDTLVVGAYHADVGTNADQGSAYVFVRSGTVWTQQAKLTASDGAAHDRFGNSVALRDDAVVVAAYADDAGTGASQGSAYVFTRSGTTWTEQAKLTASDGATDDYFGVWAAISGDTVVVGADGDDVGANANQGSAYVFTRSGTTWTEQAKLTASDGATDDYFGWAAAVSGDTVVVGAYHDDVGTNVDQGSVYVFTRSGSTWTQEATLTASDGAAHDYLGYSLAITGDTVVVGASGDDIGANADQGSAYTFVRSGTTWTERTKLTASDGAAHDRFGWSAEISGDTVAVGARYDDVGANTDQGSAYMFAPYVTECGTPLTIPAPGVLANDTDADGDSLSVTWHDQPSHGTLSVDGNGAFTYTPLPHFFGTDTFQYQASDATNPSAPALVTIKVVDTIEPTVTASVIGNNSTSVRVSLEATDGPTGSGVALLEYRISPSPNTSVTVSGLTTTTPAVTTPGAYTLYYVVRDAVGLEATGSVGFTVISGGGGGGGGGGTFDTTPPTVSASVSPATWSKGPVTVTISASDNSGAVTVTYAIGGGAAQTYSAPFSFDTEGQTTIAYEAADAAGNKTTGTLVALIDKTPPVTVITATGALEGTRAVGISASDALSGIATVRYAINGGAALPYTAPIILSAPGTYTIEAFATDVAGNPSAAKSETVVVKGRPKVVLSTLPSSVAYMASTTVTGSVTYEGKPAQGVLVRLSPSSMTTLTAADGSFAFAVKYDRNTTLQATAGDGGAWLEGTSAPATLKVRAALAVPSYARTKQGLSVFGGTLKPRHAAKTLGVTVRLERIVKGKVVQRVTLKAVLSNGATGQSRYTAATRLRAGTWRVWAVHADANHATGTTVRTTIKVK